MERPRKYTVICNKTKRVLQQSDIFPHVSAHRGATIWEDVRYYARLRLYNRVTFKTFVPRYTPYKNTIIGKYVPILDSTNETEFLKSF